MTLPRVADSLAGRMSVIRLLPLAQAEIRGREPNFLEQVFGGNPPNASANFAENDLTQRVLCGGYPEVVDRASWQSRRNWLLNYVQATIQRDVQDIARVDQLTAMPRLFRILAEFSGQLANYSSIGSMVDMNHVTARRYVNVFESLFLVNSVPPWFTNNLKRLIKSPKLYFFDSGLLAAMRNVTPDRISRNRTLFGSIVETFVFAELSKLTDWTDEHYMVSHFRDRRQYEVDFVLEDLSGRVVGIEVKAGATVSSSDFAGLRRLAGACGQFVMGIVLYDHDRVVSFGENMFAIPIAALWNSN